MLEVKKFFEVADLPFKKSLQNIVFLRWFQEEEEGDGKDE